MFVLKIKRKKKSRTLIFFSKIINFEVDFYNGNKKKIERRRKLRKLRRKKKENQKQNFDIKKGIKKEKIIKIKLNQKRWIKNFCILKKIITEKFRG